MESLATVCSIMVGDSSHLVLPSRVATLKTDVRSGQADPQNPMGSIMAYHRVSVRNSH